MIKMFAFLFSLLVAIYANGVIAATPLIFSPYKDITLYIGRSGNAGEITTSMDAGTTYQPLVSALSSTNVKEVVWAFATGDCTNAQWATTPSSTIIAANAQKFVNAGIKYVISTGGLAGVFTCSSANGLKSFIDQFAASPSNLSGIDFDIENSGYNASNITSLINTIASIRATYPNLRFSFTIATGASAQPNGFFISQHGTDVLTALKAYNAANPTNPFNDYIVNLMVMDYGAPGIWTCVLQSNPLYCDMGASAIQAAMNLNGSVWKTPYTQIALTPMIGINDSGSSEVFTLANVDAMMQWAIQNQLAGVHLWALDRDTPICPQGTTTASAQCNTLSTAPATWNPPSTWVPPTAWAYTKRFLHNYALNAQINCVLYAAEVKYGSSYGFFPSTNTQVGSSNTKSYAYRAYPNSIYVGVMLDGSDTTDGDVFYVNGDLTQAKDLGSLLKWDGSMQCGGDG